MKFFAATILITILSVIGFAQAQKSKKDKEASPSSPVANHGQEKGHEHGKEGHEHGKGEGHEHGKGEGHEHGKGEGHEHGKEEAHEHGKEEAHEHGKEEAHEHGKEEAHEHGKEKAHEHGKEEANGHGDHGHGHEEGERRNVGPDKGVLEASEELGFKLREGVEERFGIKSQLVGSGKSGNFPKGSIVYSKEEYQIFRKRDGFWKPIHVNAVRRKGDGVSIESAELKAQDLIAIDGTGFLKIVELSVFGPAIEGHIH